VFVLSQQAVGSGHAMYMGLKKNFEDKRSSLFRRSVGDGAVKFGGVGTWHSLWL
jgi:hypothetical protein